MSCEGGFQAGNVSAEWNVSLFDDGTGHRKPIAKMFGRLICFRDQCVNRLREALCPFTRITVAEDEFRIWIGGIQLTKEPSRWPVHGALISAVDCRPVGSPRDRCLPKRQLYRKTACDFLHVMTRTEP